jgi:type II secretory pathway pseudopilin PulG
MSAVAPIPAMSSARSSEVGATLVEVLVTIVLVGIGVVGVMYGWTNSIALSSVNKAQAEVAAISASAKEALRDTTRNPYQLCTFGVPTYNPKAGLTIEQNKYTVSISKIEYWDGSAFVAGCTGETPAFNRLQRVTLTVRTKDDGVTTTPDVVRTTQVVKWGS